MSYYLSLALCLVCAPAFAQPIIITSDTTIDGTGVPMASYEVRSGILTVNDGASIWGVSVSEGGGLVVNGGRIKDRVKARNTVINGGSIDHMYVYSSTAMNGGSVGNFVRTYSDFAFNGGVIGRLSLGAGEIEMSGGEIANSITAVDYDPQVMTISGGSPGVVNISTFDGPRPAYTFHIHGGQFRSYGMKDEAGTQSVANIYGTQLRKFDGPGMDREGRPITEKRVTGILADGTWFRAASPRDWFVLHNSEPLPRTVTGDANYDGRVDVSDLNMIRNNFGSYAQGDMDGSGEVSIDDLNMVRNNFGFSDAQAVPEPSGLVLMGLALASLSGIPLRCHWWTWLRRCI